MGFNIWTDCERRALPDILSFIVDNRGKTVPTDPDGNHILIATNCVRNENLYPSYDKIRTLNEGTYQNWFRAHPIPGDILFVCKGTPGRCCMVPDPIDFCIAQDMVALRCDESLVYNKYLLAVLRSNEIQSQITNTSVGDVIPHFKKSFFDQLLIPIPSLEVQKTIGDIYFWFCEKQEFNKKINENLLQQARALFRQWFSVTSSGMYKLSDIADINPETYSPKENWSFVNYLDTSNITSGTINEVQYIIPSEEKLPSRARRILRKDDVVFSTVRPNQLHYGIISNPKPNMLGSTGFAVIRSKYETIPNEIIYLALTESAFVEQMQQLAEQSVSTFPSIRPADLDACVLPGPKEGDNDFMETIKALFNAVATNNEENQRLATLRDTLLPRLMSGELDVSSLDF